MMTQNQQRLLDLCEDGQMRTDYAFFEAAGYSNRQVCSLVRELERRGLVKIIQREGIQHGEHISGRIARVRSRTVYTFRLTAEGIALHAPPPGWPEGCS